MGTGLTWDFAAASDRGILQRAQDGLDEEIAKTEQQVHELQETLSTSSDLATTGVGASRGPRISPKSLPLRVQPAPPNRP